MNATSRKFQQIRAVIEQRGDLSNEQRAALLAQLAEIERDVDAAGKRYVAHAGDIGRVIERCARGLNGR